jgi:hypothetical protein
MSIPVRRSPAPRGARTHGPITTAGASGREACRPPMRSRCARCTRWLDRSCSTPGTRSSRLPIGCPAACRAPPGRGSAGRSRGPRGIGAGHPALGMEDRGTGAPARSRNGAGRLRVAPRRPRQPRLRRSRRERRSSARGGSAPARPLAEPVSQVLVDEFQDVDAAQLRLVRLLAAPEDNLFVVGPMPSPECKSDRILTMLRVVEGWTLG